MADEIPVPARPGAGEDPGHGERAAAARPVLRDAIRYVLGICLGIAVLYLLAGRRGELAAAWHQVGRAGTGWAGIGWIAAAIAVETASLLGYAWLQRRVLRAGGACLPMAALFLLSLANDAIANTMPAEPVVSSAYRYRYYRRRGASGPGAGWAIFTILVAQAVGMSLLLLAGVLVALAGPASASDARAAVAGLVIVAGAGAVLVRRDLVLRLAGAVVRALRRMAGRPADGAGARAEAALERMRQVPLRAPEAAGIVAIATGVWLCDFLCLICGIGAVHAAVPWHDVLLAYGVAQVVGSLPVVPGGIGLVEGSLAVVLAAYGAPRVPALSAVLVYRIVSFWLVVAVGWVSVAVIARVSRARSARDP